MKKRRRPRALSAPSSSMCLLVSLPATRVGLFRFLLEAYDNLASFTVLDRREALLKVLFSPHEEYAVRRMLENIGESISLEVRPWPVAAKSFPESDQGGNVLSNGSGTVICQEDDSSCSGAAMEMPLSEGKESKSVPETAAHFPDSLRSHQISKRDNAETSVCWPRDE